MASFHLEGLLRPLKASKSFLWPPSASSGVLWPLMASQGPVWPGMASQGLLRPLKASENLSSRVEACQGIFRPRKDSSDLRAVVWGERIGQCGRALHTELGQRVTAVNPEHCLCCCLCCCLNLEEPQTSKRPQHQTTLNSRQP